MWQKHSSFAKFETAQYLLNCVDNTLVSFPYAMIDLWHYYTDNYNSANILRKKSGDQFIFTNSIIGIFTCYVLDNVPVVLKAKSQYPKKMSRSETQYVA